MGTIDVDVVRFFGYVRARKREYCKLTAAEYETLRGSAGVGAFGSREWSNKMIASGVRLKRKYTRDNGWVTCVKCEHHRDLPTFSPTKHTPQKTPKTPKTVAGGARRKHQPTGDTPFRGKRPRQAAALDLDEATEEDSDDGDDTDNEGAPATGRRRFTLEEWKRRCKTEAQARARAETRVAELQAQVDKLQTELAAQKDARVWCTGEGEGRRWALKARLFCILLRSYGIGLASVRELLRATHEIMNDGMTIEPPSVTTLGEWDWVSGPLSFVLCCARLPVALDGEAWGTTCSQDSASGSRGSKAYQPSCLALNAPHPDVANGVIQIVGHVEIGKDGRNATKGRQIREFRDACTNLGLPTAEWVCCVDHAALGVGEEVDDSDSDDSDDNGMPTVGCSSHKCSNTVTATERALSWSVHGEEACPLEAALVSFSTCCDPAATAATTKTGVRERALSFIQGGGSLRGKEFLQREVGTRYGWRSTIASKFLTRREAFRDRRDSGALRIPGSQALQRLLDDDTFALHLAGSACIRQWNMAFWSETKLGGTKHVAAVRAAFPALRSKLQALEFPAPRITDHVAFPIWFSQDAHELSVADAIINRNAASRRAFRRHMRAAVAKGLETWDRFVSHDELPPVSLPYLRATPADNDFVEGYHGTFSCLFDRVGLLACPSRVAMLAMFRHNSGALAELGGTLASVTEDAWRRAVEYSKLFKETNLEAQKRIHETSWVVSIRSELRKLPASTVRSLCDDHNIAYLNKPSAILELAPVLYVENHKP